MKDICRITINPPAEGTLFINDHKIMQFIVTADDKYIETYDWDVPLDAGWHRIEFTFDNDFSSKTIDRNLYIAKIMLAESP